MMQFEVKVKPGSKVGPLIETEASGNMTVYLRERPHQGSANLALVKLVARHFDVPRSRVEIIRGLSSRLKTIRIID